MGIVIFNVGEVKAKLCGNTFQGSESGYRDAIHESIPGIKILDDVPFDSEEVVKKSGKGSKEEDLACRSSLFVLSEAGMEEDWQILQHSIKHGVKLDQGIYVSIHVGNHCFIDGERGVSDPFPNVVWELKKFLLNAIKFISKGTMNVPVVAQ